MTTRELCEACPYLWEYGHLLPDPRATIVKRPMSVCELINLVIYHTYKFSEGASCVY